MCYRCEVCSDVVPAGEPLRRHLIYRGERSMLLPGGVRLIHQGRNIQREVPVCSGCQTDLLTRPFGVVYRAMASRRERNRRQRPSGYEPAPVLAPETGRSHSDRPNVSAPGKTAPPVTTHQPAKLAGRKITVGNGLNLRRKSG